MIQKSKDYDWASAMFAVFVAPTQDLGELAKAAELDPFAGDLSDLDCRGLDLSGQNLAGWDLRNARLEKTRLDKTELRGAKIAPQELIEAVDWEKASLDEEVRAAAMAIVAAKLAVLATPLTDLPLSKRTFRCLKSRGLAYLGDLVQMSEAEILRTENFGPKSLTEVKEMVGGFGLQLGMAVAGDYKQSA